MGFEPSGEVVIKAQADEDDGKVWVFCGCQNGRGGWHWSPRCDKDPYDR